MTAPLEGFRVVELGGFIAGPFAGQLLGDYGAQVIKIEPPEGDVVRRWGVTVDDESLWWPTLSRNKESVVLDLREPGDRELAHRLCLTADAVVENFAPGRLREWGLDYESLVAGNPGLVMTHVSGFGQDGPRAHDRGFGSVAEAMGGLRHVTGYPDRPSVRVGVSLGDSVAGLFAVIGTLAALHARVRTGLGQEVDVALYESVFALMESTLADWAVAGVERRRTGTALAGVAPSNVYPTSDGRELVLAANSDTLFRRLCAAMERPGLALDERFRDHRSRGRHGEVLDGIVRDWTSRHAIDPLEALLDRFRIPHGRVFTPADMLADAQYLARGVIATTTADGRPLPVPMCGVVPRLSATPGSIRTAGPALGAHTDRYRDVLDGRPPPESRQRDGSRR